MELADSFNRVPLHHSLLLLRRHVVHRHLVEVCEELVLFAVHATVISKCNSRRIVPEDLILLYLRKGWPRTNDAWSLVLSYLIIANVYTGVVQNDSITIIVNVVVFYPRVTPFDAEDPFAPRFIDEIVQNHCVSWPMSTVCYVCFVVLIYFILFDVGCSCVLNQNALPVVLENTIVQNLRLGVVNDSDPCLSIVRNVVVFVDSRKVFFALYYNPIF